MRRYVVLILVGWLLALGIVVGVSVLVASNDRTDYEEVGV